MKIRLIVMTIAAMLLVLSLYTLKDELPGRSSETFSSATIRQGSSGKDVVELQGRLRYLGYYEGKIDGSFGPKTKNSVTWFQWKFGMKSDGVVGAKTKLKLWEATKNWKPTAADFPGGESGAAAGGNAGNTGNAGNSGNGSGGDIGKSNKLNLSANDIKIMANAVYGESRGEPYEGQVAVAAVILNRLKSPEFPNSISGVIFQSLAFTAVADGQIWLTPNERAKQAVEDAINGWDPSDGCLYYFNPETATSKWIWSRQQVKTIGKHIFCM
ncbi:MULTISPECIES: spore cortex-lytic enzyme [unclassified Paenibacillus]|uniref:spore cortex-lytic enzyme n=1 Tax=unclassified Paenibacillus TaxID=185978 RepID=UPI0009566A1F|nr:MULTISPECIES: spore cortex-lytic enzyme [unclassified Paenibacillus]ASS65657.1 spore cortex-lytic enzyme [Paenibacillus sp. RUD330]SIQ28221.1 N-acetylmuramoyl-L-alanine amidase [Paenibacillus sp. RU4X]SIQ50474.1 N-acetylmuramoyl-L-alanine amidase [Paenibacillus sp. RU4T]